ncbi:MAG: 30S ribosomal protein S8 [Candidatus Omnitrophica bacterium]|jgi:small subunit ribosomal protein S8|nr:30S ribosomal protein S8 [Candidatus Omnitrophota bacterium]
MSVSDLIADQLTVVRNAVRAGKKTVTIKRSKMLEGIAGIAKREGFISNYKAIEDKKQGLLKLYLKYEEDGTPVLAHIERVSTPGRRQYVPASKVSIVRGGIGLAIYSTNRGLLTEKEAIEQKIGGELVCRIW